MQEIHQEISISWTCLILFAVSSIGLTHILVDSLLFKYVKDWGIWPWLNNKTKFSKLSNGLFGWIGEMLSCHQCTGFWAGMICAAPTLTGHGWWDIGFVLLGGFAGSFLGYWAAVYLSYLESYIAMPPQDHQ